MKVNKIDILLLLKRENPRDFCGGADCGGVGGKPDATSINVVERAGRGDELVDVGELITVDGDDIPTAPDG